VEPLWIALTVADVSLGVITFLKGKYRFGIVGLLFSIFWIVGAIRLAKPDSWWARRFYPPDSEKRRKADERFEDDARYAARIAERRYADPEEW
jgi:hypothetical protein